MPFAKNTKALARGDLGMAVDEYRQQSTYIGERIFRPLLVNEQAAEFPVVPIEVLLSDENVDRAMRGFYNRSGWDFEMGFYATRERGWEELLDDREVKLYRNMLDAELIAVNRALQIILRAQEKRIADKLFNTTNFTVHNLAIEWSTAATATPIDDINDAVVAIRAACGMTPNCLVIPFAAFMNIKRCAQVVDLLKYTYPGKDINSISAQQLAAILNIENVLIGDAQVNTAKKGQSAVLGEIWDDEYAMLTRIATSDDFSEPCVGRIFRWSEESGSGEGGTIVEQYRTEGNRSETYRVRNDADERLLKSYDDAGNVLSDVAAACSYLIGNVTA